METTISKEHNFPFSFIQYVMGIMKEELWAAINAKNYDLIDNDNEFGFKFKEVLIAANNTIHITQTSSDYIIEYNGDSKYQGVKLSTLLNTFTDGTRTVPGDPMLLDIFQKYKTLVLVLYDKWKEAHQYGY